MKGWKIDIQMTDRETVMLRNLARTALFFNYWRTKKLYKHVPGIDGIYIKTLAGDITKNIASCLECTKGEITLEVLKKLADEDGLNA